MVVEAGGNVREWRVIVHTCFHYKVIYKIKSREMALEYLSNISKTGCIYSDNRGVKTFIPIHNIMKIKLIPPDVDTEKTVVEVE